MDKVLDFPYSKIGEKFFPIIPLKIVYQNKEINLDALIDAGSTISIFKPRS